MRPTRVDRSAIWKHGPFYWVRRDLAGAMTIGDETPIRFTIPADTVQAFAAMVAAAAAWNDDE